MLKKNEFIKLLPLPLGRRVLSLRYPTVLAKACAPRDSLLRVTRRYSVNATE